VRERERKKKEDYRLINQSNQSDLVEREIFSSMRLCFSSRNKNN
jgi:hypothetical protein